MDMTTQTPIIEHRWAGVREIALMAGPIVAGMLSFSIMQFADQMMIAWLGTDELAAGFPAGVWAFTFGTLLIGVSGCVSTFASQCVGRGEEKACGSYTWQGVWLVIPTIALAILLAFLARPFFETMDHSEAITNHEVTYFQSRLWGYPALVWATALSAFFMSVNRPNIVMYMALATNVLNLVLNYGLIFGNFGMPELGIAGAGIATSLAQFAQVACMLPVFLSRAYDSRYATRAGVRFHWNRFKELWRVGMPNGWTMFLDVLIWGIFTAYIMGQFGAVAMAANSVAIAFMHLSFLPAMALNQAIAPIVGQWIGRGRPEIAKARTWTAVRIAAVYMGLVSFSFATFGYFLIDTIFSDDPEVILLGSRLLIIAAVFSSFDSINIVVMGALRGAGDTRWMMWAMAIGAYGLFMPVLFVIAYLFQDSENSALASMICWVAAATYIIGMAGAMYWRFASERWREIQIFSETADSGAMPLSTDENLSAPAEIG